MDYEPHPQASPASMTPPTFPGALSPRPDQTSWPKVLGITAIVFGIGGTLTSAWGIIGSLVMSSTFGVAAGSPMALEMERMKGWTIAGAVVSLALAVLLLASGVGLNGRRRWAISSSKMWAVLRMCAVVALLALNWPIQQAAFESTTSFPGAGAAEAKVMGALQIVSIGFGLLWGWALPIFMLIWLSRSKIKAEVQTWR